jgi:hypothetical protein
LIDYDYGCGSITGFIIYTVVDTDVRSFEVLHDNTERSKTFSGYTQGSNRHHNSMNIQYWYAAQD